MKGKLTIALMMFFTFGLLAQNRSEQSIEKFKNIKKVKSKLKEDTKIEIRKPDNSSLLLRQETEKMPYTKLNFIKKLKKSNKLLY